MPSNLAGTGYSSTGGSSGGTGNGSALSYGRVIDVIIDAFHPQYKDFGNSLSLNGNGKILAVGAHYFNDVSTNIGKVST